MTDARDTLDATMAALHAEREAMEIALTATVQGFEQATGLEVTKLRRDAAGRVTATVRLPALRHPAPRIDLEEPVPAYRCPVCGHNRSCFDADTGRCAKYDAKDGRAVACGCECPPVAENAALRGQPQRI